jgi:hypothetical protein
MNPDENPLLTPTDDPNITLLQEAWKRNMKDHDSVYSVGDKYFIPDKDCQECGVHRKKLEARMCANGFFSWRCPRCWKKV